MSTLDEQSGRPLTRRELRELRAKGGDAAVREAVRASAPVDPESNPSAEHHVVASSQPEQVDEHPLTRKELRRLRTNEVPIITQTDEAGAPEESDAGTDADVAQDELSADELVAEESPARIADVSSAGRDTTVDDVAEPHSDDEAPQTSDASTGEQRVVTVIDPQGDAVGALAPESLDAPRDEFDGGNGIPRLAPTFGAGVGTSSGSTGTKSFDDLMEHYAPTSPSSIIMTSSHRLPEGLGSTGAAKGTTDGREVDAVLIDGEIPAHSSPTPIAASDAISIQKNASDVIRPPAPERGRGLVFTLGITAGVLGIAAVATLATLYFTGVFNQ
ncbi:hypothetical protein [Microbacterium sp. G2-8]|uniref:hypothetical protein n=1 Tax=Microbacterium sp. G2-8 TaxID=2842454 RepID=UPI001C8A0FD6|nr:hypothetical protein [Microbacterium sp. G2-8]